MAKYELRSGYEQDLEETQEVIDLRQLYKDLLTSSLSAAEKQYQTKAQSASEQASYDISGAYANYLKQQRNVMSQGRLESGYKEEVRDVLAQQYGDTYTQARATQAEQTAKAYEEYVKTASELSAAEEKTQEEITKALQERAERAATHTELYQKYRGVTDSKALEQGVYDPSKGLYPVYEYNEETGKYELTEYGKDWYTEGLLSKLDITTDGGETQSLSYEDWLEQYGYEKELEDYQKNFQQIMKDVAGIEFPTNGKGEYTLPAYDSESGKTTKLKTEGYIDTIKKPSLDLHWSDYGWLDLGVSATNKIVNTAPGVENYMKKLGITNEDLKQATGYSSAKDLLTATANMLEKAEDGFSFSEILNSSGFNEAFGKVMVSTILHGWKSFNQGNTQQLAKDTYDKLMTQLADISKKKYTTGA